MTNMCYSVHYALWHSAAEHGWWWNLLKWILVQSNFLQYSAKCSSYKTKRVFKCIVTSRGMLDNLKNIEFSIDIDMASLENIDIDKDILENIDIDKGILQNIDIDKISYR